MFCHLCRKENRESLNILLSEESKRKRHRQNTTSLHLTALAWFIEFITGGIMLLNYLLAIEEEEEFFYRFFVPLDIFLCSVMIPTFYVLKSDQIKEIINNGGWRRVFRDILTSISSVFPKTEDGPNQNLGMDVVINARSPVVAKQDRKENPTSDSQNVNHNQILNKKVNLLNDDSISVLRGAHNQTPRKKNEIGGNQDPIEQPREKNYDDWSTIFIIS